MPELPEVETIRRGLVPVMQGRVIEAAAVNRPDLRWPLPERMAERLASARVTLLRRRSNTAIRQLKVERQEARIARHTGWSERSRAGPTW